MSAVYTPLFDKTQRHTHRYSTNVSGIHPAIRQKSAAYTHRYSTNVSVSCRHLRVLCVSRCFCLSFLLSFAQHKIFVFVQQALPGELLEDELEEDTETTASSFCLKSGSCAAIRQMSAVHTHRYSTKVSGIHTAIQQNASGTRTAI